MSLLRIVPSRGVALEALGRFDEAVSDYRAVLAAAPEDPSAWNNLGNAYAGGWLKRRVGGWMHAGNRLGSACSDKRAGG